MMPIFVCEDNLSHKNKITQCIENYVLMEDLDMGVVLSAENPHVILEYIENDPKMGVYFLDVDLKSDIDGIQLAGKIREYDPRGFIVFITTLAESLQFTFKYKVEALDYIVKDDIRGVDKKICECLDNINSKCTSNKDSAKRFSFKILDNKFISVEYDSILYFETSTAAPRKVIIHSIEGRHEFYASLKDILKTLDSRFSRCHNSFIVNTKNIREIDFSSKEILMSDGSVCLLSVRRASELKKMNLQKP